jgi:hypothetical protein
MRTRLAIAGAFFLTVMLALLLRRGQAPPMPSRPQVSPRPVPVQVEPPVELERPIPPPSGPSAPPPSRPAVPAPAPSPPAPEPETKEAIRGVVRILGPIPRRKTLRMDADPRCAQTHPEPVLRDDLVVDPDGGVRWAFVYLVDGLREPPPAEPPRPVTLDLFGCTIFPHVVGLRVGEELAIENGDPFLHAPHAVTMLNRGAQAGLPSRGTRTSWRFRRPEIMVRVGCDLHPWMSAWVGVVDHPYFSVTGASGSYALPPLPWGTYRVRVWHERYVSVTREIRLLPGVPPTLDFVLDAKK